MGYSAFQSNCIQRNAAQIWDGGSAPVVVEEHYSGGYPTKRKFDSEAYAYVYNNADYLRTRQRVESLPVEVKEAVLEAVQVDDSELRAKALESRLKAVDSEFRAMYMALMESYYSALLDAQLFNEFERRRIEQENIAIMLLLL